VLGGVRESALGVELDTGTPIGGGRSGCRYDYESRGGSDDDESARRFHVSSQREVPLIAAQSNSVAASK
jgi:hypothetical protein